jgi:rubrerythrin
MSKTKKNLEEAFAGESQACMRYLAFAEKADEEGKPGTAKLFRAAARAEMVHASSHLRALGTVASTQTNVEAAIKGETAEFKEMYPAMIKDAVAEKETEARYSLEYAMSVEMVHAQMFKKASDEESANADATFFVCPTCGYTVRGKAPKKCPYCGVDESNFISVD